MKEMTKNWLELEIGKSNKIGWHAVRNANVTTMNGRALDSIGVTMKMANRNSIEIERWKNATPTIHVRISVLCFEIEIVRCSALW